VPPFRPFPANPLCTLCQPLYPVEKSADTGLEEDGRMAR
jgi:hypothetical protein